MTIYAVVDMIKGFTQESVSGEKCPLYVKGTENIIYNINKRIRDIKDDDFVFYIRDAHLRDNVEFNRLMLPQHCMYGTQQTALDDRLAIATNNMCIVNKHTLDGFYETELEDAIHMYSTPGDYNMVIMGCCTEFCVMALALSATLRGYNVAIPEDCVTGFNDEAHEKTLWLLKHCYGVTIL